MIMLHDGVVEDHVAELIASEMKNVVWKYDYTPQLITLTGHGHGHVW